MKGSEGAKRIAQAHTGSHEHDSRGGFAANPELAREAGAKGAAAVLAKYGTDHAHRVGQLGGNAVKAKYGREHYVRIGRIGGRAKAGYTKGEDPKG